MNVHVYNRQKDLKLNKNLTKVLVQSVLEHLKASCDEVAIYFVTADQISQLHDQFFQDPTPTDCISFPLDDQHLGEVFVCPSVAIAYAQKRDIDPYDETALYVIHGLLHLLGYDDLEEKKRRTMRKKEKSCMAHLYKQKVNLRPQ